MPIFEYSCSACGVEFEELVFSSEAKPECPSCDSKRVEKKLSTFGVNASVGPCGETGCPSPEVPTCGAGACPSCQV